MHSQPFARSRLLAAGAALVLLLLAAGCASDDDQPRPPKPAKGAAGKPRHFPTLAGQQTFFNGTITADVLVGAMTGFDLGEKGGPGGPGGGHHGGGGGGHRHGGGGGGGGGGPGGGGPQGGADFGSGSPPEGGGSEGTDSGAMRRADAAGSPPVMIHLRFTNNGTEHAEVLIADFSSALGNFVVHPEKVGLDPGQSVEVEPMTSRLAGDEAAGDITLELRLGGARETKTIALALKPEPATPPPQPSTANAHP